MSGDQLSNEIPKSTGCDATQPADNTSHSPFGGLLGVLGKAKCGLQEKARSAGEMATDLAHRAPELIHKGVQNAPKIGDHIDQGATAVQRGLKSAPEPVQRIVGGTITAPMHNAADLTRLPAEIQKNGGVTPSMARRAAGDIVSVGSVVVAPGLGGSVSGVIGHAVKEQVVKQSLGGTVKDHVTAAAGQAACKDQQKPLSDKTQTTQSTTSKTLQYGCAVNDGLHPRK